MSTTYVSVDSLASIVINVLPGERKKCVEDLVWMQELPTIYVEAVEGSSTEIRVLSGKETVAALLSWSKEEPQGTRFRRIQINTVFPDREHYGALIDYLKFSGRMA